MHRAGALVLVLGLAACAKSSGNPLGDDGGADLSVSDLRGVDLAGSQSDDLGDVADLHGADLRGADFATQPDLASSVAAGVDCFYQWASTSGCAAPVLTAAYLTDDCEGTSGVYFVGHGFESANTWQQGLGKVPVGPTVHWPDNTSNDGWNYLTPDVMCITTSADPSTWSGFSVAITNPDGEVSNQVTVQDLLYSPPALPSTDSTDPFDPDACLEPEMPSTTALTFFSMGASAGPLGTLPILKRSRSCNEATGCAPFAASATEEAAAAFSFSTSSGVHVDYDGNDCGALAVAQTDDPLAYDSCASATTSGVVYSVHIADHCMSVAAVTRTTPDASHDYTETDYGGVLRF